MKPFARSILAGLVWGLIAASIFYRTGWVYWATFLGSGPMIGLAVFVVSRWTYRSTVATALWSIPSLFVALGLFGVVFGTLEFYQGGMGREILPKAQLLGILAVFWAISKPSFLWLLFPFAFATHQWVRAGRQNSSGEKYNAI